MKKRITAMALLSCCLAPAIRGQRAAAGPSAAAGANNSELTIVAANVQLLLIAPDGKETGYDRKAKKIVKGIPDSAYYQDALLAYDSGRVDPNTTQTIDVQHPQAEKYRLVVSPGTAADNQEFEVRVNLYLEGGGESRTARIAGTARRGKVANYELRVSDDPPGVAIVAAAGSQERQR